MVTIRVVCTLYGFCFRYEMFAANGELLRWFCCEERLNLFLDGMVAALKLTGDTLSVEHADSESYINYATRAGEIYDRARPIIEERREIARGCRRWTRRDSTLWLTYGRIHREVLEELGYRNIHKWCESVGVPHR